MKTKERKDCHPRKRSYRRVPKKVNFVVFQLNFTPLGVQVEAIENLDTTAYNFGVLLHAIQGYVDRNIKLLSEEGN